VLADRGRARMSARVGITELRDKVVVVTGASAGLGRETAVQFAKQGCAVVLAARRNEELEETGRLCREAGGRALSVVTDITREEDVAALAQAAVLEWGRIDIWVNNAGVTLFARLTEAPFEEHRRVLETNLYGAMFAARAAVPVFRRQKHGVLINVGSILSKVGQAFVPSYVISKFALRGLTETLRVDLADEPDIHVCAIYPYAIDTQHFESGANEIGLQARGMPPIQSPEKVARAIVRLARRPRRELHVPRVAVLGLALHALFPRTTERLLLHALREFHFSDAEQDTGEGNLYQPPREKAAVHGERPPQIGTPAFIAWSLRELLRIQAQGLRHRLSLGRARAAA
jgi:NAD(P)-dependent dehydrogenase (short-subunit alcohol dehydrogenase family)